MPPTPSEGGGTLVDGLRGRCRCAWRGAGELLDLRCARQLLPSHRACAAVHAAMLASSAGRDASAELLNALTGEAERWDVPLGAAPAVLRWAERRALRAVM